MENTNMFDDIAAALEATEVNLEDAGSNTDPGISDNPTSANQDPIEPNESDAGQRQESEETNSGLPEEAGGPIQSPESSEDIDTEPVKEIYNFLREKGLLAVDEEFEFDGSLEKFEEAVSKTAEKLPELGADKLWNTLPEDVKGIVKYALEGGNDLETYFRATRIDRDLAQLDPDNPDDRKEIMHRYYKATTSYDDAKIDRLISRLEEIGGIEEEVYTTYAELKDIYAEQIAQQVAEQQAQIKQQEEFQRQYMDAISSTIDTKYKDAKNKDKLKAFILNPVNTEDFSGTMIQKSLGKILNTPEHLVQLASLLMDNYNEEKGFVLDKLENKLQTKVTKTLRDRLSGKGTNKPDGSSSSSSGNNSFDWGAFFSN